MRYAQDEIAVGAVAGGDDFAVLTAFEHPVEGVERQFSTLARLLAVMAPQTGGLENRLDVCVIGQAGFGWDRRQRTGGGGIGVVGAGRQRERERNGNGGQGELVNHFHVGISCG